MRVEGWHRKVKHSTRSSAWWQYQVWGRSCQQSPLPPSGWVAENGTIIDAVVVFGIFPTLCQSKRWFSFQRRRRIYCHCSVRGCGRTISEMDLFSNQRHRHQYPWPLLPFHEENAVTTTEFLSSLSCALPSAIRDLPALFLHSHSAGIQLGLMVWLVRYNTQGCPH